MVETIVLHAGTPKTGTTALQCALDGCREQLAERGIVYPGPEARSKHQWLVNDLVSASPDRPAENLAVTLQTAGPACRVLVLSTEGLFNHWWDIRAAGRAILSNLAQRYRVELWVWFRPPADFCRSLYVQSLKNPPGQVPCYGRDLSVDAMLDDPWFARHLDYASFLDDASTVLRPGTVRPFVYRGQTVRDAFEALGVADMCHDEPRANTTLGACGIEMLRCLNRRTVSPQQRAYAVSVIEELDFRLGPDSGVFALESRTLSRIHDFTAGAMQRLARDYGLHLGSEP